MLAVRPSFSLHDDMVLHILVDLVQYEPAAEHPLVEGEYEVTSAWTDPDGRVFQTALGITRSNVTFLGQGIGETTILGGFRIEDQENITLFVHTCTYLTYVLRVTCCTRTYGNTRNCFQ